MTRADLVLLAANLVYATSYPAARLTLDSIPPATLAFLRCVIGGALLGVLVLGDPVSLFTEVGGVLIVGGVSLTAKA